MGRSSLASTRGDDSALHPPASATYRGTAQAVGWLFILGTVAGILGMAAESPVLDAEDYLSEASTSQTTLATGVLLELVMAAAVVGIAVVIYPVLRRFSERLAIGFIAARAIEAVIYVIGAIALLSLITVSKDFVDGGAAEGSPFHAAGSTLLAVRDWGGHVVLDLTAFSISALILNGLLYRARLVPRWLSGWGLAGAVLYLGAAALALFVVEPGSTTQVLLDVPLGLQELALALWLIVRGFNPAAFAPRRI